MMPSLDMHYHLKEWHKGDEIVRMEDFHQYSPSQFLVKLPSAVHVDMLARWNKVSSGA